MKTPSQEIPVMMHALGAKAQHLPDFGTAVGTLAVERFEFQAGVDLAPLLEGLEGDRCQCPHWGYVISGRLTVTYADQESETCVAGDVVHWPAGHSVRADEDSALVLFSPQVDHQAVLSHIGERIATMPA